MKMFTDLPLGKAINIGNGSIVVNLPIGNYDIDGVRHTVNYNGQQITIHDSTEIFKITKPNKQVVGYILEDGDECSVESYKEACNTLYQYFDEDIEEYVFPDLDTEYEVRKKTDKILKGSKPIYDDPQEIVDAFEYEVIGYWEDTGSEFIETPYQMGSVYYPSGNIFKLKTGELARKVITQWCTENNITDVTGMDHPSNVRFVKINREYAMSKFDTRSWSGKKTAYALYKDLHSAKKAEQDLRKEITDHLSLMFDKTPVSSVLKQHIYSELVCIHTNVGHLGVKKNAEASQRALLQRINKLIESLG